MADELFESDVFTLTDDDVTYYALIPGTDDDKEATEYIVLRGEKDENGEDVLVSIDDDEEFDRIADIFDDEFADIDYDADADEDDEE